MFVFSFPPSSFSLLCHKHYISSPRFLLQSVATIGLNTKAPSHLFIYVW